jgi:hypothetical protein
LGGKVAGAAYFSPLIKPSPIDAQIETCDIALAAFCSETAGL